jgi:hypothetical protein
MVKKRPLAWRLDGHFATTPLFDVIAGGPKYGGDVWDWLKGMYIVIRLLASPRGRAFSKWQRAYDRGRPEAAALYRKLLALEPAGQMPSYSDDETA